MSVEAEEESQKEESDGMLRPVPRVVVPGRRKWNKCTGNLQESSPEVSSSDVRADIFLPGLSAYSGFTGICGIDAFRGLKLDPDTDHYQMFTASTAEGLIMNDHSALPSSASIQGKCKR